MKLGRSPSWMTKIERGERQIDSVTMLLRVADALNVELHNVTGRPYFPEPGGRSMEGGASLKRLRKAVMRPDIFTSYGLELSPRPVAELREDARRLRQQYNMSPENFSAVVPLLPVLLDEVQSAIAVCLRASRAAMPKQSLPTSTVWRIWSCGNTATWTSPGSPEISR